MPKVALPSETLTRAEVIARLRNELLEMTDEENCACKAVAERGIFCNGFRRYTDEELREHYWWIVRRRPDISRAELEKIANDWQLTQQEVQRLPLACDVQSRVRDTCKGWNDFTDEQLEKFYWQMTGKEVRIE